MTIVRMYNELVIVFLFYKINRTKMDTDMMLPPYLYPFDFIYDTLVTFSIEEVIVVSSLNRMVSIPFSQSDVML